MAIFIITTRTKLEQDWFLTGTLANKISNTPQDSQPLIFASGFDGGITDLQVGPDDGYSTFLPSQVQYIE